MSKFITTDPPYNAGLYPTTAGFLELANGIALDSTLTNVTDQLNTPSALYLSTNKVRIGRGTDDTSLVLFGTKGYSAIFNTSLMLEADRTFTFPNANMTFAGINIAQTFTAAQTFDSPSAFGESGSPIRILTNPWTSGNANQNHPLLLFGLHGGSIWAASPNGGTYIGINAVASFPGNFLDFHVNGGASLFRVSSTGAVTSSSSMTLGSSSLSAIRLYVRSDGTNSVFRVDNSTPQRLFEVDNNSRLILGNSGLLLAYGNSNFALTSQLATGYSYIFGNAQTKASASSVTGTLQLNESISNPSGATSSYRGVELNYSINNSAGAVTGTATGIFVNGTETGSGLNGMTHNLMDLQTTIGGTTTSRFTITSLGEASGRSFAGNFIILGNTLNNLQPTAIIQFDSTTRGVLFPRMTTTQKNLITPLSGTVIYDSTLGKLCVRGATNWETITSV